MAICWSTSFWAMCEAGRAPAQLTPSSCGFAQLGNWPYMAPCDARMPVPNERRPRPTALTLRTWYQLNRISCEHIDWMGVC